MVGCNETLHGGTLPPCKVSFTYLEEKKRYFRGPLGTHFPGIL